MTTFIERLETEKSELDDKISKLNNFLNSDNFKTISEYQQLKLTEQVTYMTLYSRVLNERLQDLKKNKYKELICHLFILILYKHNNSDWDR